MSPLDKRGSQLRALLKPLNTIAAHNTLVPQTDGCSFCSQGKNNIDLTDVRYPINGPSLKTSQTSRHSIVLRGFLPLHRETPVSRTTTHRGIFSIQVPNQSGNGNNNLISV